MAENGGHVEAQPRRLRVFYATGGPQDVVEAYRQEHLRQQGKQFLVTDVSEPYANQLLEACAAVGAAAWVVSPHPRADRLVDGAFTLEHRPRPKACAKSGLTWHLGIIAYQLGLMWSALRYRADVVVVGAAAHYWLYAALRLLGVRVVPILHCTFWPTGFKPTGRAARIVNALNGWFWRRHAFTTIAVSDECGRQVREVAGRVSGPIVVAMPLFRRNVFAGVRPPPERRRPFVVTFAGRVERYKGVFDVLDAAALLEHREPGRFTFEICGSGGALEELRRAVEERAQGGYVRLSGWLDREQMAEAYGRSHVVLAPTTSRFEEGFCQVAAEAVLAGRPLIASQVVPAIDHVGGAVVVVKPDDVEGLAQAILRLADDPDRYEELRSACSRAAAPFYDWNAGLGGVMLRILSGLQGEAAPAPGPGGPARDQAAGAPVNQSADDRRVSR